jgi:hypothetical protein
LHTLRANGFDSSWAHEFLRHFVLFEFQKMSQRATTTTAVGTEATTLAAATTATVATFDPKVFIAEDSSDDRIFPTDLSKIYTDQMPPRRKTPEPPEPWNLSPMKRAVRRELYGASKQPQPRKQPHGGNGDLPMKHAWAAQGTVWHQKMSRRPATTMAVGIEAIMPGATVTTATLGIHFKFITFHFWTKKKKDCRCQTLASPGGHLGLVVRHRQAGRRHK